jgi:hypothetical protein
MKTNRSTTDSVSAARERMELYFIAHPGSPAAVRRPHLIRRGNLWVVLLGKNVREGIVGIGPSVEQALRAFDAGYLNFLRPSPESDGREELDVA